MDDIAINKGESQSGSPRQAQGQATESGRSLQQSGERGMTRSGHASLFSLTPRDFFTASPFELMRRFTEDMDRFSKAQAPEEAPPP